MVKLMLTINIFDFFCILFYYENYFRNLKKTIKTINRIRKKNQIKNKMMQTMGGVWPNLEVFWSIFGHLCSGCWPFVFWPPRSLTFSGCLSRHVLLSCISCSFGHLPFGFWFLAICVLASTFLNEPAWDPV